MALNIGSLRCRNLSGRGADATKATRLTLTGTPQPCYSITWSVSASNGSGTGYAAMLAGFHLNSTFMQQQP
jgi:hypothetical protein